MSDSTIMNLDLDDESLERKTKPFYEPVTLEPKNFYMDAPDLEETNAYRELSTELMAKAAEEETFKDKIEVLR